MIMDASGPHFRSQIFPAYSVLIVKNNNKKQLDASELDADFHLRKFRANLKSLLDLFI